MVQQILAPRVEHSEKTDRGAEMLGIRRDLQQRGGARPEEQVVHDALVLERQPRELVWQREDDVVIADWQEFVLTCCEPLVARVRQTLRAVTIPARVVRDGAMIAARTAIEMAAQRRGAAARQGAEHAPVLPREPGPVRLDEAIAVFADDVGHLEGWFDFRGGIVSLRSNSTGQREG